MTRNILQFNGFLQIGVRGFWPVALAGEKCR